MNAEDSQELQALIELAREETEQNRRILLENVAFFFVSPEGRLSEHEVATMWAILRALVHSLEMALRREIAQRPNVAEIMPNDIVDMLADAEAELTCGILQQRNLLRDAALIEIIKHRAREHMMSRLEFDEGNDRNDAPGADAEEDLLEVLMRASDAALSRLAASYVLEQAGRCDRFQQPVLTRPEVPEALVAKILWWIAAALQRYIFDVAGGGETIERVRLDDLINDATQAVIATSAAGTAERDAASQLVERLDATGRLDPALLIRAARQGHLPLFAAGLGTLCRLDAHAARRIVLNPGNQVLALACKVMGFEGADFETLLSTLRHPGDALSNKVFINKAKQLYYGTSRKNAMRALGYWNQKSEYLNAIEQMNI